MLRITISVVHLHDDSEETADFSQAGSDLKRDLPYAASFASSRHNGVAVNGDAARSTRSAAAVANIAISQSNIVRRCTAGKPQKFEARPRWGSGLR